MKFIKWLLIACFSMNPLAQAGVMEKFNFGNFQVEASADSIQVWGLGLAGPPAPLIDGNLFSQIGVNPRCTNVPIIMTWLFEYRAMLQNPKSKAADVQKMGKYLEATVRLAMEEGGECRDLAMATYTIGSVYLLSQAWNPKKSSPESHRYNFPSTAGWTYLAIAAFRNGLITFTHQKKTDRVATTRRILGSYDCESLKIAIDPVQRPLNLAATMIHELSHFYFDKFSAFNILKDFNGKNFRYLLLLEEALASAHAGFLQREFTRSVLSPQLQPDGIGDNTHYSVHGPLSKISDRLNKSAMESYPFLDFARATFFIRENMIVGGMKENPLIDGGRGAIDEYKYALFNKIAKSYFGHSLSVDEQKMISPENMNSLFTPTKLGGGFSYEISLDLFFLPFTQVMWSDQYSANEMLNTPADDNLGVYKVSSPRGSYQADLRSGIQLVASIVAQKNLHIKSLLCRSFENEVRSGALKDYIGFHSLPATDEKKPGVNGTRPGVDGVRPGVDGTRPNLGVRPCLQINDDFL